MPEQKKTGFRIDPRAGLFLLFCANIIAFTPKSEIVESTWIAMIAVLYLLSGLWKSAVKWCSVFAAVCAFQEYIHFSFPHGSLCPASLFYQLHATYFSLRRDSLNGYKEIR